MGHCSCCHGGDYFIECSCVRTKNAMHTLHKCYPSPTTSKRNSTNYRYPDHNNYHLFFVELTIIHSFHHYSPHQTHNHFQNFQTHQHLLSFLLTTLTYLFPNTLSTPYSFSSPLLCSPRPTLITVPQQMILSFHFQSTSRLCHSLCYPRPEQH